MLLGVESPSVVIASIVALNKTTRRVVSWPSVRPGRFSLEPRERAGSSRSETRTATQQAEEQRI